MLELRNITKAYKTKSGDVKALNNLSLTFPAKGLVFITGKSGCGKTTLLNVIGGLDDYDSGEISLLGKSFKNFTHGDLNDYRNTFIGFIFQEYNVLNEFTVEKNIELAMELQGLKSNKEEVDELLRKVEIDGLRKRKPTELSGGQRQRLAIARALVKNPRIIMADEPTGALDSNTGIQVIETLKELSKDKLIIVVSHDQEFAEKYADRIIRLVDGRIAEDVTYNNSVLESNINSHNDKVYIKEGSSLNNNELQVLADAIKNNKKLEFVKTNLYREKTQTDEGKIEKTEEKVEMTKSKMKLKSSLAMGVKSLGVKPLRLIFTILLSVVAFAVFGLFDTIASFTTESVVSNLIQQAPSTISFTSTNQPYVERSDIIQQIKISDNKIDALTSEFGTKVKGVYNFSNNDGDIDINEEQYIREIMDGNSSPNLYYSKSVSGFIEFSKSEISGKKFNDFDYEILYGYYPQIKYQNGELVEESTLEIAISSYMADSLMYFLGARNPNYSSYKNIVNNKATITIYGYEFKIVGIIDCGKLDAKYDPIKKMAYPLNDYITLEEDFKKTINSGAHKCVFASSGFLKYYKEVNYLANIHYAGTADWTVESINPITPIKSSSASCYTLSSNEYNKNNMLFFNTTRTNDKLADDEVLIHPQNLHSLLESQLNKMSQSGAELARSYINKLNTPSIPNQDYIDLSNDTDNPPDYFVGQGENKVGYKYGKINLFKKLLETNFEQNVHYNHPICIGEQFFSSSRNYVSINVIKDSGIPSRQEIEKELKVVGIYCGINLNTNEMLSPSSAPYAFMMNNNLLKTFEICTEQGSYSRILVRPQGNAKVTNAIASYLNKDEGFKLVWFMNGALEDIQKNQGTIKQFSELFLYAALVLAVFSIFMLFNYITMSIANKRHSTGILRALGANGKDVFSMFLIESMIIAMINGILAVVFSSLGCTLVNSYIANVMNIAIPFALFGIRQVVIILGVSIATAFLSSAIPIIRIVKEKPVNLIRRS